MAITKSEKPSLQIHMEGGDGKNSYSKNSTIQQSVMESLLGEFDEGLQHFHLPSSALECIRLADLGCSSGPNCIRNADHIVRKIRAISTEEYLSKSVSSQLHTPVQPFQVLFNDLAGTDFNNLFKLLTAGDDDSRLSDCFVAGVPGSFHDRLFPSSSIHIFFSSYAVHFLSKIPDEVLDKNSPAYNKDSDWLVGATPATIAAYKKQSSDDLRRFLRSRATEMVPGGLLFMAMAAFGDHHDVNYRSPDNCTLSTFQCMNEAFKQLVSKGFVSKETIAGYNIPLYFRTRQEVLQDIESCGEFFDVKKVECLYRRPFAGFPEEDAQNSQKACEVMLGTLMAGLGPMLQSHIGMENFETYKDLLRAVLLESFASSIIDAQSCYCVASLIRRA